MRPTTSASNLFRRQLCPGSARLEAGLPDEDSELSREGDLLHEYSAHPERARAVLKSEQRDLLELADTLTTQVIETVGLKMPGTIAIERRFEADGISGQPDRVYFYEGARLVIDRKFGYNVVTSADLNLQLRVYAVITAGEGDCYVAIVQPRAPADHRITIARYTPEDIDDARMEIASILKDSNRPDALLFAGEDQCRYCKAKLVCPAFRDALMLPAIVTPDDALSKTAREAYMVERLSECNDEQLEKVMNACRLAEFAKDMVMDEARKRIKAGALTNFKLGKAMEVRLVNDVRKAIALLNLAGLPKDQIFECITNLSLIKLSEAVRKAHPTWGWKETNEWINNKLKTVIETETRKERVLRN